MIENKSQGNIGGMHRGLPSVSSVLANTSAGAGSVGSSTVSSARSSVYEHIWAKSHMMQGMMCKVQYDAWIRSNLSILTHKAFLQIYPCLFFIY
jgi:hypothetical protein